MNFHKLPAVIRLAFADHLRSAGTWIFGAVMITFALLAAPQARYTPEMISSMVDPSIADAITSTLAEPSWQDALAAWVKNLNQICGLAFVIVAASKIHGALSGPSAPLVLTRGVGRGGRLLAEALAIAAITAVIQAVSIVIAWISTAVFFSDSSVRDFLTSGIKWWLFVQLAAALMLLASSLSGRFGAVLGAGLAGYLFVMVGTAFPWVTRNTPVGLLTSDSGTTPVVTAMVAGLVAVITAMALYERREVRG